MQLLILEGGIGQSDDASGEGKDFEVMAYHPGPWEREREEALHLSMPVQFAAGGAFHILIFEAADPRQPRLAKPIEKEGEIFFRLAWEADDEGGPEPEVGADGAPALDAIQGFLLVRRAAHRLQHIGCRMTIFPTI